MFEDKKLQKLADESLMEFHNEEKKKEIFEASKTTGAKEKKSFILKPALLASVGSLLVVAIILSVVFLSKSQPQTADTPKDDFIFERAENVYFSEDTLILLNREYETTAWVDVELFVYINLYKGGYEEYDELMRLQDLRWEDVKTYGPLYTELENSIINKELEWLGQIGFEIKEDIGYHAFILKGDKQAVKKIYDGKLYYVIFLKEETVAPKTTAKDLYGSYTATALIYQSPYLSYKPASDENGMLKEPFTFEISDSFTVEEVSVEQGVSRESFNGFEMMNLLMASFEIGLDDFKVLIVSEYKKFEIRKEDGSFFATVYVNSKGIYIDFESLSGEINRLYRTERNS